MSEVYDNWERLVEAVLKREYLKEIALCESLSSSVSPDFSFSSSLEDVSGASSGRSSASYQEAEYIELEEIKKATKNFQRNLILEEGAYGPVFKGWIDEHTLSASKPGYGMAIAVNKNNFVGVQGILESIKELHIWSQLHHPNVVRLIGYCCEKENWFWAYEFMPRGSLDNHLFGRGHQSLSWEIRIKVATGVARGLSFLHDREIQIIHRDVKSSVVLLDGEYNAKLSGFGLARDGPTGDMTHITTQVIGTCGYAAPEYIMTGQLTAKCDVYSFGVVLLELLSGRRVIDTTRVSKERNLVEWAAPHLGNKRRLSRIMDKALQGQYPQNRAYKVATLASRCLRFNPKRRPQMTEVLVALEQL